MAYPAWQTNITMERSTIAMGKLHYFDWAIFQFADCQRLAEGRCPGRRFQQWDVLQYGVHSWVYLWNRYFDKEK